MHTQTQKINTRAETEAIKSSRCPSSQYSHPVLKLQQQLGNQAVQRLLASKRIQAKLTIGAPNDKYEQEADRVADQVMRMPEPTAAEQNHDNLSMQTPVIQRLCPECEEELQRQSADEIEEEEEEEEETLLQRQLVENEEEELFQAKEMPSQIPEVSNEVESTINNLRGGGQPLSTSDRSFFEPRFGKDFSQVRIHTDTKAADTAKAVNARAFTLGHDVVFGAGEYQPGSKESQRLLAHELTHTVQQKTRGVLSTKTLQRTIGDGHDLVAPRFSGNLRLEAAFDNEILIEKEPPPRRFRLDVQLLQQSLLDMGYTLPEHGVDGRFGPETKAAIKRFQRDIGFTGRDVDGIVGPNTMAAFDDHDVTNTTGNAPPENIGPIPSPRPGVGGGCSQHFATTGVTFTLANQTGVGVGAAALVGIAPGPPATLVFRGVTPPTYVPDITITAPSNATAQEYEVGLIQNELAETVNYIYDGGGQVNSNMPTPIKDGAPLSSGAYHTIFAENGTGHPNILGQFTASGNTQGLVLPDIPSDSGAVNIQNVPSCVGPLAAQTLNSAVVQISFRTWVGVRHIPSGCVEKLHHIDWSTNWSATLNATGTALTTRASPINVTTPNGNGSPNYIQGGQVPADVFAAGGGKSCTP